MKRVTEREREKERDKEVRWGEGGKHDCGE